MAHRISLTVAIVLIFSACIFANRRLSLASHLEAMPLWRCQRIVSTSPSVTETLYALGLGDRVVGDTRFCDFPPDAKNKPKIGGFYDISFEAIVALKPDLVIVLDGNDRLIEGLEKLHIETLVVSNKTIQGVIDAFREIGRVCGRGPEGRQLAVNYQRRLDWIRKKTQSSTKPKVLLSIDRIAGRGHLVDVYVAGADDYFEQIIECAGGENAYRGEHIRYPVVSPEGILWLNPDVIVDVISKSTLQKIPREKILADWNDLDRVRAVKDHRIVLLDQSYAYVPGPRTLQLVEELARALHPEVVWEERSEDKK